MYKKIFLTGGTGLIGSSIAKFLSKSKENVQVKIPVRNSNGIFIEHPFIEYKKIDFKSHNDLKNMAYGCDFAIITAGITGGFLQNKNQPWLQVTNNILLDTITLQAIYDAGIKSVIYLSSATVYPNLKGKITETDCDWSENPQDRFFGVGWAKRNSEKLCEFWSKQGMDISVFRLSNVYGPGSQFKDENANVVAALIKKFCDAKGPMFVWGSPKSTRDFLFVDDLSKLIIKIIFSKTLPGFNVFNVGSGTCNTIEQLVISIKKAINFQEEIQYEISNENFVLEETFLNIDKIKNAYAWYPSTELEEGVELTTAWWKKNQKSWKR